MGGPTIAAAPPTDYALVKRLVRAGIVHKAAFDQPRPARSHEYREGHLCALQHWADPVTKRLCPHAAGTVHADAWMAGWTEASLLWPVMR